MHVRGFTRHESSRTEFPGTYRGVVEKLDHLKVQLQSFWNKLAWLHIEISYIFLVSVFDYDYWFIYKD